MGVFEVFEKAGSVLDNAGKIAGAAGKIADVVGQVLPAKNAEAVATVNAGPQVGDEPANALMKIKTVKQLSAYLTTVKNAQDSDSALAAALNAQLQVLSIINSPLLTLSAYDLILESLNSAVEKAENAQQKKEFQRNAAIMTNSIIFFLDARLYWENDKWNQEGLELLKKGCMLVSESTIALLQMLVKTGTGVGMLSDKLGMQMYTNLIRNTGDFFAKLFDFLGKEKRINKYREEFYSFLLYVFDKFQRYRDVYGAQVLLTELILRYKDTLVPLASDPRKALQRMCTENTTLLPPFKDNTQFKQKVLDIMGTVTAIFPILYLFNWWGGDKWLEYFANSGAFETLFTIHFSILELPFMIKLLIALSLISIPVGCLLSSSATLENVFTKRADEYFIALANSFSI
jgi:BarA-like signal transduction histidine kinase